MFFSKVQGVLTWNIKLLLFQEAHRAFKTALAQLAKSTAIGYTPYGINVNAICPETIDTPYIVNALEYLSINLTSIKDISIQKMKNIYSLALGETPQLIDQNIFFLVHLLTATK